MNEYKWDLELIDNKPGELECEAELDDHILTEPQSESYLTKDNITYGAIIIADIALLPFVGYYGIIGGIAGLGSYELYKKYKLSNS